MNINKDKLQEYTYTLSVQTNIYSVLKRQTISNEKKQLYKKESQNETDIRKRLKCKLHLGLGAS